MISTATLYTLVIWAMPAYVGDEPIYIDIRPMTYVECRQMRNANLAFYEMLRNQEVTVICVKEQK